MFIPFNKIVKKFIKTLKNMIILINENNIIENKIMFILM